MRYRPRHGELLSFDVIRGAWRPSGSVAGAGVFAVVWEPRPGSGEFWAPLHDFDQQSQGRLIAAGSENDQEAARHKFAREGRG
jgi:hypothetical protein